MAATALSREKVDEAVRSLSGWQLIDAKAISKTYSFKNYYETMAFVNAVAWIAHQADHHPDLEVGYNKCKVTYSTHSVGGLSQNDVDAARQVEELLTS
jgi:4a-hydroxytetrahydrobiopterin dehydratase